MKTHQKSWLIYAFATFFLFGITNFQLSYIAEKTGGSSEASLSAIMVLWFGMGIMGLISSIVLSLKGQGIRQIRQKSFIVLAAVCGLLLSCGMLTLKLGFIVDPLSKGPIVAMTSANAMLVTILAWIFIKERLNKNHLFGLVIIILGLSILATANSSSASIKGILFGLATMLLFGITNFFLKYVGHRGANPISIITILWSFSGLFGVIAITISYSIGRQLAGIEEVYLIIMALCAGFTLGSGMLTLKLSVIKGPAGPATAIAGCNALLVTVLDLLAFGHLPSFQKNIGMMTAIVGIVILSLTKRD